MKLKIPVRHLPLETQVLYHLYYKGPVSLWTLTELRKMPEKKALKIIEDLIRNHLADVLICPPRVAVSRGKKVKLSSKYYRLTHEGQQYAENIFKPLKLKGD